MSSTSLQKNVGCPSQRKSHITCMNMNILEFSLMIMVDCDFCTAQCHCRKESHKLPIHSIDEKDGTAEQTNRIKCIQLLLQNQRTKEPLFNQQNAQIVP